MKKILAVVLILGYTQTALPFLESLEKTIRDQTVKWQLEGRIGDVPTASLLVNAILKNDAILLKTIIQQRKVNVNDTYQFRGNDRNLTLLLFLLGLSVYKEFRSRNHLPLMRVLLKAGADVNRGDVDGFTPLMYTVTCLVDCPSVVILLKAGAQVDAQDNRGMTALMHAIVAEPSTGSAGEDWEKKGMVINALIATHAHANVNLQNRDGRTALFYACSIDHMPTVQMLLAAGADPLIKDNDGKTAFDYAKNPEITRILQEAVSSPKQPKRKTEEATSNASKATALKKSGAAVITAAVVVGLVGLCLTAASLFAIASAVQAKTPDTKDDEKKDKVEDDTAATNLEHAKLQHTS